METNVNISEDDKKKLFSDFKKVLDEIFEHYGETPFPCDPRGVSNNILSYAILMEDFDEDLKHFLGTENVVKLALFLNDIRFLELKDE